MGVITYEFLIQGNKFHKIAALRLKDFTKLEFILQDLSIEKELSKMFISCELFPFEQSMREDLSHLFYVYFDAQHRVKGFTRLTLKVSILNIKI